MIFIIPIASFIIAIILYSKYRNKIWVWQELYLNIFGNRAEGNIIESYISSKTIVENHIAQQTYIMAIEYMTGNELFRTKVIVTDSYQGGRYEKGNKLFIMHNKKNIGISILNYSKYRYKKEKTYDKNNEQKINDLINKKNR